MKEFKGKVAVITGAASGIGRGIAERCVREGMKVVLADIDEVELAKAETELKVEGGTALGVRTDVSKRSDVELLARKALDAFGQVHLPFNNAGIAAGGAPWEATWNDHRHADKQAPTGHAQHDARNNHQGGAAIIPRAIPLNAPSIGKWLDRRRHQHVPLATRHSTVGTKTPGLCQIVSAIFEH